MLNKRLSLIVFLLFILHVTHYTLPLYASATWEETSASDFGDGYLVQTDTWTSAGNVQIALTTPTWYNSDWLYRKTVTIINSTATLANFQVWIPTGTNSGQIDIANADLDSKLQDDYDDVRFTDSDGTTLLDFWICPSTINKTDPTGFWVKVPSISEGSEKTIYFYYGNDSVSTNLSLFDNTMQKLSTTTAFDSYNGNIAALWNMDDSNLGSELVNDGELDTWTDSTDLTNWVEESTDTAMRKVTEESAAEFIYSGSRSAKLEAIDNNYTSFYIKQTFDTVVDENYQISFYLNYSSRTYGDITAELWNDGSKKVYQTISSTVGFADTFRFVSFRATATAAGVNAGELRIWMSSETYGYAYVDLISIKKSAIITADASANNNTGTIVQNTSGSGASFTSSDSGQYDSISTATVKFAFGDSLKFDGVDDYIDAGNSPIDTSITGYSVSMWVNPSSHTTTTSIFSMGLGAADSGVILAFLSGSKFIVQMEVNAADKRKIDFLTAAFNEWSHLVITYDKGTDTVVGYLNGTAFASAATGGLIGPNYNTVIHIGKRTAGNYYNGIIDEVVIYNVALSTGEIQSHYERRKYANPAPTVTAVGSEETKYYSAGSYSSYVYDTEVNGSTMTLVWFSSSVVSNSTLYLEVRSSNTLFSQDDATITWETISDSSDTTISSTGQYFQYRSSFTTTYSTTTPVLNDVSITYLCAPSTTPPTGFEGTSISTYQITWAWTDQTPGGGASQEESFKIYTSTDGLIYTTAADEINWAESGLNANEQYSRYVQAYNVVGSSNSVIVSTYTHAIVPGQPTSTKVGASINIIINENGNSSVTEYAIAVSSDGGGSYNYYVESNDSIGTNIDWRTKTGWYSGAGVNVNGLTEGFPYRFRVKARNACGVATTYGSETSTIYTSITPPTGISFEIHLTSISLTATGSFSDLAEGDAGVQFNEVNTPLDSGWVLHATTWTAIGLSTNTQCGFKVRKRNGGGEISGWTDVSYVYTLADPPADLSITSVSGTEIGLSWTQGQNGNTSFGIERAPDIGGTAGAWSYIITSSNALTSTVYTNTALGGDTTYWYRVRGYNGDGVVTTYSNVVSTVTGPAAPTGFAGVVQSASIINWSWTNNSTTVTGYRVMTSTDGVVADLLADTTSYAETGLSANSSYTRYVNAVNQSGSSDSNSATVYTLASVPGSLTASEVNISSITITWSGDGTRYAIERSTDEVDWIYIQQWSNALTSSTYTDTGLNYSTKYYYRIGAYNGAEIITSPSSQLTVTTLIDNQPPSVPASVTISPPAGQTKVKMGDTLILSASAEAGSTIYSITVKDQDGNILAQWIEPSGTVMLSGSNMPLANKSPIQMSSIKMTPSGDVSASILIGDIAARYPLAESIMVELVVQDEAGNKSPAGSSAYIYLSASTTRAAIYNNLFNPVTGGKVTIRYEIIQPGEVEIKIYTLNGEKVITLVNEIKTADIYYIEWDGRDRDGDLVASDIYICYIEGPDLKEKKKICVIK